MAIPEHILNRKGARTKADVPDSVVKYLEAGRIETRNLMENLVVDRGTLLVNVCTPLGYQVLAENIANELRATTGLKYIDKPQLIAARLTDGLGQAFDEVLVKFQHHVSDLVRTWAAYMEVKRIGDDLPQLLTAMRLYATDTHAGVREDAWLCIRSAIVAQPQLAIALLIPWVSDDEPNIRRYATEATRPIGVWCPNIRLLQEQPTLGLPLLEPLMNDPSKYVQDSVANWLNDAAKNTPDWVLEVTEQWLEQSPTKATARIVKRARRSIR